MDVQKTENKGDQIYRSLSYEKSELEHCYGKNIHILTDPVSLLQLADLCQAKTRQPAINNLVRELYQFLVRNVVRIEFPIEEVHIKTRMAAVSEFGIWTGRVIKKQTKTVTVNIMRAGALPSQVSFDFFNRILDPDFVRQDHVVMSRITDEKDRVTGAHMGGSKIGGDVDNSMLLFPDPMGATGTSISEIISFYKEKVAGKPLGIFALHLMVTPEYLARMKNDHPDVKIYALRLDRGASSAEVLSTKPGSRWKEESGLSDKHYIVPGGGGFGEIINNSFC
ncbi:MAG: uracil phosphoribosyltransferase [Myxococcales bacterium]|nr:uracil phosphoribosyltransferase [Myxococcales bacterium]USN51478.1 MAG: uracil phosphoribosyltransferase [Myxococcales bacterium]